MHMPKLAPAHLKIFPVQFTFKAVLPMEAVNYLDYLLEALVRGGIMLNVDGLLALDLCGVFYCTYIY